jgi:transcriptional regulator with XRE-family HTH domain
MSMISGMQIRLARAALRFSVADLAKYSGIGVQTVIRLEAEDGVPSGRALTVSKVRKALEDAGIEFIGKPEEGPGIRYWPKGEKAKD